MRKTLAKGGSGDKMATALMNHIEKERKKLSVKSSSSLMPRSTRRLHLQKGEYGVHLPAPAGPFIGPQPPVHGPVVVRGPVVGDHWPRELES